MNFDIKYTEEDIKAFEKILTKKFRNVIITACIAAVLATLKIILDFDFTYLMFDLLMIFIAVFFKITIFKGHKLNIKVLTKDMDNLSVNFNQDSMECKAMLDGVTKNSSNILYTSMVKVVESSKFFFVYVNTYSAQVIAKRIMTEEQIADLRKFLQSKFKKYTIVK